ncbi:MAG: ACT domain-containing protein [Aequoribacter sp.]|uniref:ACT domain-containing protein n=1 Tax=Aequoribacter sp. TaxID=2847771 RepID=UPI003C4AEC2C
MTGETQLATLLRSLDPELAAPEVVFVSFADAQYGDYADLQPLAMVQEAEGMTLVVQKALADQFQLAYDGVFQCITLKVHSSLQAVGLTAAVSRQLAQRGISANVLAGYYHDHIFVPAQQADTALSALKAIESL